MELSHVFICLMTCVKAVLCQPTDACIARACPFFFFFFAGSHQKHNPPTSKGPTVGRAALLSSMSPRSYGVLVRNGEACRFHLTSFFLPLPIISDADYNTRLPFPADYLVWLFSFRSVLILFSSTPNNLLALDWDAHRLALCWRCQ